MRTVEEVQSFLNKKAAKMRLNPTTAEKAMRELLDSIGIRYVFQSIKFSKGTYRIFDFYIPKKRIVIEVDGKYHDSDYDAYRDEEVKSKHPRYKILRFPNEEVLNSPGSVRVQIEALL